jgi:hypothetical protein
MSLLDNKKRLLIVCAVLIAIKFILLPWFEWQNTQVNQIAAIEKQLQKGLLLVNEQQELTDSISQLQGTYRTNKALIASEEKSVLDYQLKIQKQIEALLSSLALTTRSVSWLNPLQDGHLEEHRMEISLTGSMKSYIQFMIALEQINPKLTIDEFRSNISKMYPNQNKLGRFNGKIVIVGWRNSSGSDNEKS